MNCFWVYLRQYGSAYEPAEGGYYVETSYIDFKERYYDIYSALESYKNHLAEIQNEGWKIEEIHGPLIYFNGNGYLRTPLVYIDRNGGVGDGASLGISTTEPQDEPYEGYC